MELRDFNLKLRIENLKLSHGIAYMVVAVTFLATQQVLVKFLPGLPPHEIVFFRALTSFIISSMVMYKENISFRGNNYPLLILRGIVGTSSLITFFYSLQHIPLATAVTVGHLSPVFLGILAVVILKESISIRQWISIAIAFLGIVLIKGFDNRINSFDLSIAVFSAMLTAMAHFTVRLLKNEAPLMVLFYFSLVMMLVIFPFLISSWKTPRNYEFVILIGLSIVSHYAQLFLTKALKAEEIGKINGIYYLGIVLSILSGFIIFDESFNYQSIVGMILILGGVLIGYFYKS
jgi:drug/metabolite transporter (DMT)-like permease